jgi:hypothetical protein
MIPLTPDEEIALIPILKGMSETSQISITLERLVDNWGKFSQEVANGYRQTGYDYANHLGGRDLLDRIVSEVPPRLRDRLFKTYLDPADSRFRNASRPLNKPVFGAPADPKWWWLRAPNDLSGALAADLLTEKGLNESG